MLARERTIIYDGATLFRTPLLVPSFSSKGFPDVRKIVSVMTEFITDATLVSAYDLHYGHIKVRQLTFPSLLFLDSGGYEARVDHDLSEAYGWEYKPKRWVLPYYHDILEAWRIEKPTIVVSYDTPRRHSAVAEQIRAAARLFASYPHFVPEFLLKPERKGEFIEPELVRPIAASLKQFAIIGVTERELDTKIIGRMEKIARLRGILDAAEVQAPIHVFGSLDTFSTPLYFLSGAEIFDGLTWLRFGYHSGYTMYTQNYGAIRGENGILKATRELAHSMWKDNYYYLESLRGQMRNFARDGQFGHFASIAENLKRAVDQLHARLQQ